MVNKTTIYIVSFILIIIIIVLLFNKFRRRRSSTRKQQKCTLYYFFTPSCPHCVRFTPIWDQLVKKLESKKNIELVKVDATKDQNLAFYYNVTRLPTIILVTSEKPIVYNGDRSVENIYEFVSNTCR